MFDITKLGRGDKAFDLVYLDYVQQHPEALAAVLLHVSKLPRCWCKLPQYRHLNEILKQAKSTAYDQRYRAAINFQTPNVLLELLAKDTTPEVRVGVALNKTAPQHLLEQLLQDEIPYVRVEAEQALQLIGVHKHV